MLLAAFVVTTGMPCVHAVPHVVSVEVREHHAAEAQGADHGHDGGQEGDDRHGHAEVLHSALDGSFFPATMTAFLGPACVDIPAPCEATPAVAEGRKVTVEDVRPPGQAPPRAPPAI